MCAEVVIRDVYRLTQPEILDVLDEEIGVERIGVVKVLWQKTGRKQIWVDLNSYLGVGCAF